jgi:hypothetical protein
MPLTTITTEELPMANQDINPSQKILNELDNELIALEVLMFEAKGVISIVKFLSQKLRNEQCAPIKH